MFTALLGLCLLIGLPRTPSVDADACARPFLTSEFAADAIADSDPDAASEDDDADDDDLHPSWLIFAGMASLANYVTMPDAALNHISASDCCTIAEDKLYSLLRLRI